MNEKGYQPKVRNKKESLLTRLHNWVEKDPVNRGFTICHRHVILEDGLLSVSVHDSDTTEYGLKLALDRIGA